MTSFVDLGPSAERVAGLLPGVDGHRLDDPTPCSDSTVGDLLSHLLVLSAAFRAGAEKAPDPGPPPDRPPALDPD